MRKYILIKIKQRATSIFSLPLHFRLIFDLPTLEQTSFLFKFAIEWNIYHERFDSCPQKGSKKCQTRSILLHCFLSFHAIYVSIVCRKNGQVLHMLQGSADWLGKIILFTQTKQTHKAISFIRLATLKIPILNTLLFRYKMAMSWPKDIV